ncbi:MAG: chorismate synthase [Desulfobacterales bacterium]|nr:chorismate synthase [Desulfobacterales bacterium]
MRETRRNNRFDQNTNLPGPVADNADAVPGGISSGESIHFGAALKPPSTIEPPHETVDSHGNEVTMPAKGRFYRGNRSRPGHYGFSFFQFGLQRPNFDP